MESRPQEPTARTAGRFVADALAAAGVRVAFTVPGETFLSLLEGCAAAGIRVVATRHEGGAGLMAAAAATLSGRPTALLVTRAVGAANMAIGLHAAQADSAPVIAIAAQVDRGVRGREAFQEADLATTVGGLCRWAREIRDVAALPGALDEALRRATTGRPGPVLLALPADLLDGPAPVGGHPVAASASLGPNRSASPDPALVRRALHLLLDAQRPVILAGAGVLRSRGTADLVRLAEMVHVPVIAGWRRPDVFPNDNPLYLGMSGLFAAPGVRERLQEADALLVIGSRLGEVATFGYRVPTPSATWVHVDIEAVPVRPGLPAPALAITADARTFLREARRVLAGAALEATSLDARREANAADRAAYEAACRVDAAAAWDGPGINPGRVVAALNAALPPDAIVATDAGNFGGWAARGLVMRRPGTFLGPTSGAMGYGVPAAVAASMASPGRPVVGLVGDGGFGMTGMELETAVREGAHPVILLFDNARYGTIADHQEQRGMAPVGTRLGEVDWVAVAEGLGARGIRVDSDDEIEPALRAALGSRRTTVLHLRVDPRLVSVDRVSDGTWESRTVEVATLAVTPEEADEAPPAVDDEEAGAPAEPVEPAEPDGAAERDEGELEPDDALAEPEVAAESDDALAKPDDELAEPDEAAPVPDDELAEPDEAAPVPDDALAEAERDEAAADPEAASVDPTEPAEPTDAPVAESADEAAPSEPEAAAGNEP
jgi:acetolactate synthase I/II/III large subunit